MKQMTTAGDALSLGNSIRFFPIPLFLIADSKNVIGLHPKTSKFPGKESTC